MRILKYNLVNIFDLVQKIEMEKSANVLHVDFQGEYICIWALCDDEFDTSEVRSFIIYATGESFNIEDKHYLSTLQDDSYVYHVFELL